MLTNIFGNFLIINITYPAKKDAVTDDDNVDDDAWLEVANEKKNVSLQIEYIDYLLVGSGYERDISN